MDSPSLPIWFARVTQQLQYFVIYYSPAGVFGSARINLGVVLLAQDASDVRFIDDWGRVQSLQPDADIELFQAMCREIEERIKHGNADEMIRVIEDSFSNMIQVSERMECQADDPVRAMNDLASEYLH